MGILEHRGEDAVLDNFLLATIRPEWVGRERHFYPVQLYKK